MAADNYRIREDYVARAVNATIEAAPGDYWTETRKITAGEYQFDVYRVAAELARKRLSLETAAADIGGGYPSKLSLVEPFVASIDLYDQPSMAGLVERDFPGQTFHAIDLERPHTVEQRYDLVICSDVLEHLLDPDPCVAFLRKITKPTGYLVISTPERDVVRGPDCLASPKLEHVREWNRSEFTEYLESRGLEIERVLLLPPRRLSADAYKQQQAFNDPDRPTAELNGCQVVIAKQG